MMTRHTLALAAAAAVTLVAAACGDATQNFGTGPGTGGGIRGNGNVVEETRSVSGISRVDHWGVGTLYIEQGATTELRVRAEENLLEYLRTEVEAGELLISKDVLFLTNTRPIEYHLTVPGLERAELSGAGAIRASDLDTGALTLWLTGAGNIEFTGLTAPSLEVLNSGVGDLVVSGTVPQQNVRLETLGSYEAGGLASSTAVVRIEDGGSATVRVADHLDATITGSGNLYYYGDPVVDSTIQGTGRVQRLGD